MISKPKKVSEQSVDFSDDSIKEFMKFFKIELKSEKEISNMTKQKRRQYECRVQRWDSLVNTHIEYEIYKSLNLFYNLNEAIPLFKQRIDEIRADPQLSDEYDAKMLTKMEKDMEQFQKQLKSDRKTFDDLYIPYKKRKAEEMLEIKTEEDLSDMSDPDIKSEDESDIAIKEEYISDEDIKEEYISDENTMDSNGEYFSAKEEDIDDKTSVKKEIKTKINVKSEVKKEIKREVKSEVKTEIKNEVKTEDNGSTLTAKVKKEYMSSDDDE